jgi:nucleoid-associated protein YgaU
MEPAAVLCAGVAIATLLPGALRRAGRTAAVIITTLGVAGLVAVATPSVADPLPPIVRLAPGPVPVEIANRVHEVVRGESLWRIAATTIEARTDSRPRNAAVAGFWPRIYERNRTVIGDDPNLILPGQRLEIPEP